MNKYVNYNYKRNLILEKKNKIATEYKEFKQMCNELKGIAIQNEDTLDVIQFIEGAKLSDCLIEKKPLESNYGGLNYDNEWRRATNVYRMDKRNTPKDNHRIHDNKKERRSKRLSKTKQY